MTLKRFAARIYIEKLKLNPSQSVHNIFCPFHSDEQTPSMSINLDKAVHYCHGACANPKGGGPLQFLLKWARYVDKKPIMPIQARAQLRSAQRLVDAQTFARDQQRKEVMLFVHFILPRLANRAKFVERAISDLDAYAAAWPKCVDDEVWDLLAICHRELDWTDRAFQTCLASLHGLTPTTIGPALLVFAECQRRGWWNPVLAMQLEDAQQRQRRLSRPVEDSTCRVSPSRLSPTLKSLKVTRQPIPRRSPIR